MLRFWRWLFGDTDAQSKRDRALMFLLDMEERDRHKPKTMRQYQEREMDDAVRTHGSGSRYVDALVLVHRAEAEHVAYSEQEAA